ncbi:hypothetical protein V6N13_049914 [Hibiscus sabdariffa]
MRELKVLSLTLARDSPKIITLYALASLVKLRTLHLENFEDLSFLGNLGALEILSLRWSNLEGLEEELVRLENLKILDVTGCMLSSRFPTNVLGRMFKLEELYLKLGERIEGAFDDTLHEINSLSRLTALSLQVSSFHIMEGFEFSKLERYNISSGRWGNILTEKSWKSKEVIPLNVVSLLPEGLESLQVSANTDEFMKCLIDKGLKLSNLKLLHVGNLSGISELPTQHVRVEGLVDLRIRNCPSLRLLFPLSLAQSMVSLETLEISDCHGLKQIVTEFEEEEMPSTIHSHHSHSVCLPKLRQVEIQNCDGLEYIFPALMGLQGHQGLSLYIWGCPELEQVIKVENDVMLQQLQFLGSLSYFSVGSCPHLVARLEATKAHLKNVQLSAFKGSFNRSKHLELYETTEDHSMVPDANEDGLNELTSLEVNNCHDFECLVDTTTGNGPTSSLNRLEILRIKNSNGLETLCKGQPPHGFLKNLKDLAVKSCSKLRVVFQMDDLQNLKVIKIEDCWKLESLFSPSLIQSLVMLEQLSIEGCNELKALFTEPENDGEMCLPKLKTLDICRCSKLECVVPITLAQGLPTLASLQVSDCKELKQVFGMGNRQDGVEHDGENKSNSSSLPLCLPQLKTLSIRRCSKLECVVPENYIVKAPVLKSISASGCPKLTNIPIQHASKQLSLETDDLSIIKKLPYDTDHLYLHNARDHKILLPHANVGHLDRLTSLHIACCYGSECLVDTTSEAMKGQPFLQNLKTFRMSKCNDMLEVFRIDEGLYNREENQLKNLEHLRLELLYELREIVKGPTHCVNLQSLKVLNITKCRELRSVFSVSVVRTLVSLEELMIVRCNELKTVFMESDGTEPDTLCLSILKTMKIKNCQSLEFVFPHALAAGFPRLQEIRLVDLGSLRSVVAGNICLEAPALEIIEVRKCSVFTDISLLKQVNNSVPLKELSIFSGGDGSVESKNMENSQLCQRSRNFEYITIGNFEQLLQLQGGYSISNLEIMDLRNLIWLQDIWKGSVHVATNLKELQVHNCNNLTYIFPIMLIPHLPQLRILRINSCGKLKKIFSNHDILTSSSLSSHGPHLEKKMRFSQFKEIYIIESPRLESFTPLGYHLEFPCLEYLTLEKCYKMITSFTVDYLTLTVHAKINQASQADDASPSQQDIRWGRHRFSSLPQYVEETEEISPLK